LTVSTAAGQLSTQIISHDATQHVRALVERQPVPGAPLAVSDHSVRLAVVGKLDWIRRKQASFEVQPRQSRREMVSGESHYVWGRRYRLNVIKCTCKTSVRLRNNKALDLYVRPGTGRQNREAALYRWYRQLLRDQIPALIAKWEPAIGVSVADWGIKKMKTRWGTCNIGARRIWLNLELAKKSSSCLEYILVHEMVHILERHHSDRFLQYMDRFMPQWRLYREELNRAPLAHERWNY
jgi:predicted metal-dependent hydrolase